MSFTQAQKTRLAALTANLRSLQAESVRLHARLEELRSCPESRGNAEVDELYSHVSIQGANILHLQKRVAVFCAEFLTGVRVSTLSQAAEIARGSQEPPTFPVTFD